MNAMIRKKRLTDFFATEYKKMVLYVRRIIDDSADRDAEDIVQDVMTNIFDTPDLTIPIENLSAYIHRSLKNKVIDIFRKKGKIKQISLDSEIAGDPDLSLVDFIRDVGSHVASEAENKELYMYLYEMIETLSQPEQALIWATEFEGITFAELSEEWDVPLGTLLTRKARAIKKIKERLNSKINGKL